MNILKIVTYMALLLVTTIAIAHGPSRQKVLQEIEINAPPQKVWAIIADFCGIQNWHPMVKSCVSDNGSEVNSVRTIELDNGEKIQEKLYKIRPDTKLIQFALQLEKGQIIKGMPIATHGSTIQIMDHDGKAKVVWKGAFYRAFPGQNPPPELSDEAAKAALQNFYQVGLENIKKIAEQ